MPMTTAERSLNASRARSRNARTRRFQRALQEMRDSGLVVHVREENPETGEFFTPVQYEPGATFDAVYR